MSTDDNKLTTEIRESFGKGAARKLRAVGKVPAVLYGHGTEPQHLTVNAHDVFMLVRRTNAIIDLQIEGKSQLALVKDVQRNPVLMGVPAIEHLDLVIVQRGEKVTVDVPVHVEGEPVSGFIAIQDATSVSVEVEALHIPESFTVSVEGLEDGARIVASEIELPGGAELLTDGDTLVVAVQEPQLPAEDEETEAAEGDEAEAAEGDDAEAGEGDSTE